MSTDRLAERTLREVPWAIPFGLIALAGTPLSFQIWPVPPYSNVGPGASFTIVWGMAFILIGVWLQVRYNDDE